MSKCGHCNKIVKGIRDHIRDKHGFPYYCMSPDFEVYYGKWRPPSLQTNDLPDPPYTWMIK